jgi:hypothetical protein
MKSELFVEVMKHCLSSSKDNLLLQVVEHHENHIFERRLSLTQRKLSFSTEIENSSKPRNSIVNI